jgi:hypothetical protein
MRHGAGQGRVRVRAGVRGEGGSGPGRVVVVHCTSSHPLNPPSPQLPTHILGRLARGPPHGVVRGEGVAGVWEGWAIDEGLSPTT